MSITWSTDNSNPISYTKHHSSLLSLHVALRIITSTISTKCLHSVVDTVFISVRIQHGTAHDEGGKFQHHHVWSVWITFRCVFVLESAWRTKHLAPDTSRPVTHLVDRPRDRGKDRWMENSMAGGREREGAVDTVGFGGREQEKTRIMCLPERQEKEGMLLFR